MLNQPQTDMLRKLAFKPLSVIELAPEITSKRIEIERAPGVKLVQRLTKLGYARDYGAQHSRRVPVRLRIWGITDAGRAVLEQQSLGESKDAGGQSQLGLVLGPKPPLLTVKKYRKPITTNQLAEFSKRKLKKVEPLLRFEVEKDISGSDSPDPKV